MRLRGDVVATERTVPVMRGRIDMYKSILVIAGSDSIAGAGIEIDIKTAAAHGIYATCAITSVTSQNTLGVHAIQGIHPDVVASQIRSVVDDVPPSAVKIGMVGNRNIAFGIRDGLLACPGTPVVLDPVLVATSGGSLADDDAVDYLLSMLAPLATVVTPNLPEASALTGIEIIGDESSAEAALILRERGVGHVLIKGGHLSPDEPSNTCIDRLYLADGSMRTFEHPRLPGEYHGTGCSLSTAIACNLASGMDVPDAVGAGTDFLHDVLEAAHAGRGNCPPTKGVSLIDPFSGRLTR